MILAAIRGVGVVLLRPESGERNQSPVSPRPADTSGWSRVASPRIVSFGVHPADRLP